MDDEESDGRSASVVGRTNEALWTHLAHIEIINLYGDTWKRDMLMPRARDTTTRRKKSVHRTNVNGDGTGQGWSKQAANVPEILKPPPTPIDALPRKGTLWLALIRISASRIPHSKAKMGDCTISDAESLKDRRGRRRAERKRAREIA